MEWFPTVKWSYGMGNGMNIWEMDKIFLVILFVIPGFISIKTYELLYPGQIKESSKQIVDAVAYSCINYAFLFTPIYWFLHSGLWDRFPIVGYVGFLFVLFGAPVLWVLIWKWFRESKWLRKQVPHHPTVKPWDYVFAQEKPYWVKVTLKDGTVIGGKYAYNSFVSSSPAEEQIYLEETWVVNEQGGFERSKQDTAGVIILNSEMSHIEFFEMKF